MLLTNLSFKTNFLKIIDKKCARVNITQMTYKHISNDNEK